MLTDKRAYNIYNAPTETAKGKVAISPFHLSLFPLHSDVSQPGHRVTCACAPSPPTPLRAGGEKPV